MSYLKGRRFEWQVKNLLEKKSWLVVRAARSKPVDLVALKNGLILLIECKYSSKLIERDKSRLIKLADIAGALPIIALRKKYWRKIQLINLKTGAQLDI
ncbi:MAG: hypothetical protein NZ929_01885 [Aigarchaeota archaeon]|nr:hypothetical protein [Aigarchaeota archaeon]MCX8193438.1 hypothetical protein [Nitrososphaeria archaeon]MDW7985830.1 hypothetical protein [Nitrososphaerota archaeon]